jgi:23S rRNA (adenine2503-C2)-methyltransferase
MMGDIQTNFKAIAARSGSGQMNLLGLTCAQLADQFRQRYGKGTFHASALYRAFFSKPDLELESTPLNAAAFRLGALVKKDLVIQLPRVVDRVAAQGVSKLVFELADGQRVESVIIPMVRHATVCISSQVGCRMGCRFCRTGRMGWRRNLTAAEIVAQVYMVKVHFQVPVRNVVFMGMGEPLDNFEEVVQAVQVLEDQRGLNIAKRHMTLSTVGLPEAIERLAAISWPQLNLAVSLNAPNDDIRSELMPINGRYSMAALKCALNKYILSGGRTLFVEYVLIKGINDDPALAGQLAAYLEGLPFKLNLIALNPGPSSAFQAPGADAVERFRGALVDQGIFVRLRSSKGASIQAACGQLGGDPG